MSDTADRISRELDEFLAPERRCPDPPAAVRDDVLSRVGATLGWSGSDPGPGSSGPAPSGARALARGSLAKSVATLVVGGVIGAGVHEGYDRARERRAEQGNIVAVAPPPGPPPPPPAPAPAPAPLAAEPQPKPSIVRYEPPRPRRDRNLAAERALIEQGRTALGRDQGDAALTVLERHARDFPEGELAEERESLQVQALVGLERFEQARKVAARFHRRFPRSIFGTVVDEALKSIP